MIDRSREKSRAGLGLISCRWKEWGWDSGERRRAIFSKDTVAKLIVRTDDLWDRISRIIIRKKKKAGTPGHEQPEGADKTKGNCLKCAFFFPTCVHFKALSLHLLSDCGEKNKRTTEIDIKPKDQKAARGEFLEPARQETEEADVNVRKPLKCQFHLTWTLQRRGSPRAVFVNLEKSLFKIHLCTSM